MFWAKKNKSQLFAVLIVILTLVSAKPYLSARFPYTHDGENHLARFANYKLAIKEGQFPPRFAPGLLNNYGYPVFNYNYPLANTLSLPFSALKINYEWTFKILVVSFLFFGLVGTNRWLKSLGIKESGRFFSLALFASSPYLVSTLNYRGNIGEIMAICLLPWLFYFVDQAVHDFKNELVSSKKELIFATMVWTMFFLSHNIAVLFGSVILVVYALLKHQGKILDKKSLILQSFIGLLLSMWFWIPAVLEKNLVVLDKTGLSKEFVKHFPTSQQLLFSPLEFGFSWPGSVDTLSFSLGLTQVLVIIVAGVMLVRKKMMLAQKILFAFSAVLIIFQLQITQPIWQIIPLANFIQFPWRLSLFFMIMILPLIGTVFSKSNLTFKVILAFMATVQIIGVLKIRPADYFHKSIATYDAYRASTSTANENIPKDFTFEYFNDQDWQPTAIILEGEGEVMIKSWRGSERNYDLVLSTDATIVEPTANFAGWSTEYWPENSDGPALDVEYLNNEEIGGRIAYQLPAGTYQIKSEFTQNTLPRFVGHILTAVGLGLLSALIFLPKKKINRYA